MVPVPLLKDVPKAMLRGPNTEGQIWGPRRDPPRASRVPEQEEEQGRLKALPPDSSNPADVSHPCSSWGGGRFKGRFEFKKLGFVSKVKAPSGRNPFPFLPKAPEKALPGPLGLAPALLLQLRTGGHLSSINHYRYKPVPAQTSLSNNHSQYTSFPA